MLQYVQFKFPQRTSPSNVIALIKKFISFIAQSRLVAALDILLLSCESSTPLALVLD